MSNALRTELLCSLCLSDLLLKLKVGDGISFKLRFQNGGFILYFRWRISSALYLFFFVCMHLSRTGNFCKLYLYVECLAEVVIIIILIVIIIIIIIIIIIMIIIIII